MPTKESVDVVVVDWEGPFGYQQVIDGRYAGNGDRRKDRGLYQIYCNHHEPDTLMYVGRTEASFSGRIAAKQDWLHWESSSPEVYLGRIVGVEDEEVYRDILARTELLLIYYCSPPVNKHCKMAFEAVSEQPSTVIINYRKRFRLPYVVSNLAEKPRLFELVGGSVGKELEKLEDEDPTKILPHQQ